MFNITNANEIPFLSTTTHESQLVYSYDGDAWHRFTNNNYNAGIYNFNETFIGGNTVQIATFFPFSYAEMNEYIDSISTSQWVDDTDLGASEQSREIHLLNITNSSVSMSSKEVIYIIGRQHAHETASSHMLKGLIDFLISDDNNAEEMRDNYVWYIVPIVNPDGVYLGKSRATSEDRDPNRDWKNDESIEINIVRNHINDTDDLFEIDFFIDWHSQMNDDSWYNFVYSPPGNTFFSILSSWTYFDSQTSSTPDIGSSTDCTAREYISHNIIMDPMFVLEPTPHLNTWTIATLEQEGVNTAYAIHEYFGGSSNIEPVIQSETPTNSANDISVSTVELSVSIMDDDGDLLNFSIETSPNVGSIDHLNSPGESGGVKTCSISGLTYNTVYTWYVNATDGEDWAREIFSFTTEDEPIFIVDSTFDASTDSADLRANNTGQDWYESRGDDPTLLTLNMADIGGNSGKKAAIKNFGIAKNVYLTQEYSSPQSDIFDTSFVFDK